ncbi:ABC transporter permease [Aliivibrio finisterrensis]|uniref:ABC transporter permease n=1 Tax=Aliivibrio finisterrensis TaxID=511998 RepID=UPI001021709F|nr:ABC transporter permease [Aliivibrio finisterrensis]RYU65371.1 ABC transporter permease [Aliivibrio finisterrensis]
MSFLSILKNEAKGIFTNSTIVLAMIGGVLFYAFLYPLPYLNQSPEEQKITVVDLDKSELSQKFILMANASQQLKVVEQAESIEQAKQQFLNNTVSGFLVIPYDFSDKLQLGQAPTVSYAGDASYFLVYGTIIEGLMKVGGTLSAEYRVAHMAIDGTPITTAINTFQPFKSNYTPVFNRNMGYVEYVVPAVFVLILQQTLLMAVGVRQKAATASENSSLQLIARFSLFLISELILASFYFGFVFDHYHISRFSNVLDLLIIMVPFIASIILLGMLLARWFPTPESILLVVLFSSMPIVFSAGFIWPTELIPNALTDIMHLLPSGFAIDGFLRLNQMGAGLHSVLLNISGLYGLCLLYGLGLFISKQK